MSRSWNNYGRRRSPPYRDYRSSSNVNRFVDYRRDTYYPDSLSDSSYFNPKWLSTDLAFRGDYGQYLTSPAQFSKQLKIALRRQGYMPGSANFERQYKRILNDQFQEQELDESIGETRRNFEDPQFYQAKSDDAQRNYNYKLNQRYSGISNQYQAAVYADEMGYPALLVDLTMEHYTDPENLQTRAQIENAREELQLSTTGFIQPTRNASVMKEKKQRFFSD